MPEIVQQARLTDDEIATLAAAIDGNTTEHLLRALRFKLKPVMCLKRAIESGAITLDDTTLGSLRAELTNRLNILRQLPDGITGEILPPHEAALALLDDLDPRS